MKNYEELEEYLLRISGDRALIESFRANNPNLVKLFTEIFKQEEIKTPLNQCPSFDTIQAFELSIFDNWRDGEERGTRYKAVGKAYTNDPIDFKKVNWKATYFLWDETIALAKAADLQINKKNPISNETLMLFEALLDEKKTGLFGIARYINIGDGTIYFNDHVMHFDDGIQKAIILSPNASFVLNNFVPYDAAGKTLKGNVYLQSRHSPNLEGWRTEIATKL